MPRRPKIITCRPPFQGAPRSDHGDDLVRTRRINAGGLCSAGRLRSWRRRAALRSGPHRCRTAGSTAVHRSGLGRQRGLAGRRPAARSFYAFPLLYASSFSGFYLALNIVLWLLIFRALGIELRMHLSNSVWAAFFDGAFSLASILLIVFFGAALGNVLRGVPLGADHYFFVPLWTDFRPGRNPGILDWYTVLCAVITLAAVSIHGALYLIVKTEGEINARLRRLVGSCGRCWRCSPSEG